MYMEYISPCVINLKHFNLLSFLFIYRRIKCDTDATEEITVTMRKYLDRINSLNIELIKCLWNTTYFLDCLLLNTCIFSLIRKKNRLSSLKDLLLWYDGWQPIVILSKWTIRMLKCCRKRRQHLCFHFLLPQLTGREPPLLACSTLIAFIWKIYWNHVDLWNHIICITKWE